MSDLLLNWLNNEIELSKVSLPSTVLSALIPSLAYPEFRAGLRQRLPDRWTAVQVQPTEQLQGVFKKVRVWINNAYQRQRALQDRKLQQAHAHTQEPKSQVWLKDDRQYHEGTEGHCFVTSLSTQDESREGLPSNRYRSLEKE